MIFRLSPSFFPGLYTAARVVYCSPLLELMAAPIPKPADFSDSDFIFPEMEKLSAGLKEAPSCESDVFLVIQALEFCRVMQQRAVNGRSAKADHLGGAGQYSALVAQLSPVSKLV